MNTHDAARAMLVAYRRVVEALQQGAKGKASPEDLGVALVALGMAADVLARSFEHNGGRCHCGHWLTLHHRVMPEIRVDPSGKLFQRHVCTIERCHCSEWKLCEDASTSEQSS